MRPVLTLPPRLLGIVLGWMHKPTVRRRRRRVLTDKQVAAFPRKRKRYIVTDPEQRGLYLRIPPQGPVVYAAVAYDPHGRQVWHTIGRADLFTIEEAREQAREAIRRIKTKLSAEVSA